MTPCRVIAAVACDEVRQEITRKYFLIGAYVGSIGVLKMPGSIALSLFLELEPTNFGQFEAKVRVIDDDSTVLVSGSFSLTMGEMSPFGVPLGPYSFQVTRAGRIRFQWKFPDSGWEDIKALQINHDPAALIRLGLAPNGSPLRSEQSPSGALAS